MRVLILLALLTTLNNCQNPAGFQTEVFRRSIRTGRAELIYGGVKGQQPDYRHGPNTQKGVALSQQNMLPIVARRDASG